APLLPQPILLAQTPSAPPQVILSYAAPPAPPAQIIAVSPSVALAQLPATGAGGKNVWYFPLWGIAMAGAVITLLFGRWILEGEKSTGLRILLPGFSLRGGRRARQTQESPAPYKISV
ncbi:MAG: hypothetical protein G01um101429_905, partial [Parcubacteria group bacterium Gr01-1014_29]